jgi:hypothetical protein
MTVATLDAFIVVRGGPPLTGASNIIIKAPFDGRKGQGVFQSFRCPPETRHAAQTALTSAAIAFRGVPPSLSLHWFQVFVRVVRLLERGSGWPTLLLECCCSKLHDHHRCSRVKALLTVKLCGMFFYALCLCCCC